MTDDEIIAVVQAHKDGKQIQRQSLPSYFGSTDDRSIWHDAHIGTLQTSGFITGFDFERNRYRVKPEPRKPREWILHISSNGSLDNAQVFNSDHHNPDIGYLVGKECVKVMEILK